MIDKNILEEFGASLKQLEKGEILFSEGEEALYYFQIKKGSIKAVNWGEDGKEFIQGIFKDGQSFGEPALFGGFPYPSSSVALSDTLVYKLSYPKLLQLLESHFDVHLKFIKVLCKRLEYKSMILKEIAAYDAEHRIISLIEFFKKQSGQSSLYEVKLTRQNLADLTGLRVETVIRTVKILIHKGRLSAKGRKIFY